MSKKSGGIFAFLGLLGLSVFLLSCGTKVSRSSGLLFVVSQASNQVNSYAIDQNTGNLSYLKTGASTCAATACGFPVGYPSRPNQRYCFRPESRRSVQRGSSIDLCLHVEFGRKSHGSGGRDQRAQRVCARRHGGRNGAGRRRQISVRHHPGESTPASSASPQTLSAARFSTQPGSTSSDPRSGRPPSEPGSRPRSPPLPSPLLAPQRPKRCST